MSVKNFFPEIPELEDDNLTEVDNISTEEIQSEELSELTEIKKEDTLKTQKRTRKKKEINPSPAVIYLKCKKCKIKKTLSMFEKDQSYEDGYKPWCMICIENK